MLRMVMLALFLIPGVKALSAQSLDLGTPVPASPTGAATLLTDPADSPGVHFLFDLEAKFARATAEGGGKAFASWFAENATSLSNGKPPVVGRAAIARQATWSPRDYQLEWTPDGGLMNPGGGMGYTWGHYTGRSRDAEGNPVVTTGRYITLWEKETDGQWKVVLDASNEGPALDCCKLP